MPVSKQEIEECARRLKTDPAFKEIIVAMKASIFIAWGNQPDANRREELYRDAHAVACLEDTIAAIADGAELDARKAARANSRTGA